jgi:alkanesulfonate monooxygenase SsuD/methylene tetrahydromethanopterin reductase-like flavin-dependent oxidoreductase (luciferase family)
MVNIWPRPIQKPHPPVWVPGTGSLSTWDFSAKHDHCYCFLSYFGNQLGKRVMDGYWEFVDENDLEPNPFRAGFLQLVAVGETDEQAERDYAEHIQYFYAKCLHIPPHYLGPPGFQDYRSLEHAVRSGTAERTLETLGKLKEYTFKDFVDDQFVICGSPATVRDQLDEAITKLRVGNLMVLLHIGSMPHDLTLRNIDLFASEVLPHLRHRWDDEWENKWWPESLRSTRELVAS